MCVCVCVCVCGMCVCGRVWHVCVRACVVWPPPPALHTPLPSMRATYRPRAAAMPSFRLRATPMLAAWVRIVSVVVGVVCVPPVAVVAAAVANLWPRARMHTDRRAQDEYMHMHAVQRIR